MGDWRDKAACRDMDLTCFPTTRVEERSSLKACFTCPVVFEYARYASEHAEINGYPLQDIWGGRNIGRENSSNNNETEMQK